MSSWQFQLPPPWKNINFNFELLGPVTYLVGPNGSGKSKFAFSLRQALVARFLSTDRLSGMEQFPGLRTLYGDQLQQGLAKGHFEHYKQAGTHWGTGLDSLVLLEERLDIRIQVEATLSQLFDRDISLDWESGFLIPRATIAGSGVSYRLDRDECHGIKEITILLAHLYDDKIKYLIIDEPELNLHPQLQAFFMQEVRRLAGDPTADPTKKAVILVTHSPFILDLQTTKDISSVISFSLDFATPSQVPSDQAARVGTLLPRLNVHHKQLFFADNPIFVEGVFDAQVVGAIQNARGVSVVGAGSCIIDAGGSEEVNYYLLLCMALKKKAHFLYDLDSLFSGNLRSCIRTDGTIAGFLAASGVSPQFAKYCGELDSKLTALADQLLGTNVIPTALSRLKDYLTSLGSRQQWDGKTLAKARVAILTAISRCSADARSLFNATDIAEVDGRLQKIVTALRQRNIHLLPGGTLERYLPSYAGDHFELSDEAKRKAVEAELACLASPTTYIALAARYGDLYVAIKLLPCKPAVSPERTLRTYLSQYIHDLQSTIINHPDWDTEKVRAHMGVVQRASERIFSLSEIERKSEREFSATVRVAPLLGGSEGRVEVTHRTIAGTGEFVIEYS